MMQQMLVGLGGGPAIADSVSYGALGGGGSGGAKGQLYTNAAGAGAVPKQGTFSPTAGASIGIEIGAGGIYPGNGGTTFIMGVVGAPGGGTAGASGQYGASGGSNSSYSGGSGGLYAGGGGAGAGGAGQSSPQQYICGNGGPGVVMPFHPTGLRVGGGGGAKGYASSCSGSDGGGNANQQGPANRGGGGGANQYSTSGANGASGRVVLRYLDSFPAASATTGSVTVTVSGGYRYYDFTSTGSITF